MPGRLSTMRPLTWRARKPGIPPDVAYWLLAVVLGQPAWQDVANDVRQELLRDADDQFVAARGDGLHAEGEILRQVDRPAMVRIACEREPPIWRQSARPKLAGCRTDLVVLHATKATSGSRDDLTCRDECKSTTELPAGGAACTLHLWTRSPLAQPPSLFLLMDRQRVKYLTGVVTSSRCLSPSFLRRRDTVTPTRKI